MESHKKEKLHHLRLSFSLSTEVVNVCCLALRISDFLSYKQVVVQSGRGMGIFVLLMCLFLSSENVNVFLKVTKINRYGLFLSLADN